MGNANAAVAVFGSPLEIASAVRDIQSSGLGSHCLSLAGREQMSPERLTGYYTAGDRIRCWGEFDEVWNELSSTLSGWALYVIPGIGPVLVIGPLAEWIARALPNAPIFGGMTAVGMGLHSLGISRESIRRHEEALKEGRYLLLLHGPAQEVAQAREIIGV